MRFVKHGLWLVVILLCQLAAYQYLNNVVLAPSVLFTQQEIATGSDSQTDYSPDGRHYAKISQDAIRIYTEGDKLIKEFLPTDKNETLTYNGWIPAQDLALVVATTDSAKTTQAVVHTVSLGWWHTSKEYVLQDLPKGTRIVDTAFFSGDNSFLFLVKNNKGKQIYQVREGEKCTLLDLKTNNIRRIAALKKRDILLFDRPYTGKTYYRDEKGTVQDLYPQAGSYALLGVDKNDMIYLAKMVDGTRASLILRGTLEAGFSEYKVLSSPYPVDAVRLNYDGSINYY